MKTDLGSLLKKGIITQDTYEWLKPLHDKENADLEEIKRAALERKNNPFYQQDSDDESGDDAGDLLTTTTTVLNRIEGTDTSIIFVTDDNSTGHGNKVWHASIATCRYLKDHFLPLLLSGERHLVDSENRVFRCLELGAGTAVPSFFLAELLRDGNLSTNKDSPLKQVLRITDAKYYRNIMQILRSIEIQQFPINESLAIEVYPHNWGETVAFGKTQNDDDSSPHDLVIVSDCIYNPVYHNDLLVSLSRTLGLPSFPQTPTGGIAIVSFSLHGNVQDSAIWEFLESKLPSTTRNDKNGTSWRLNSHCVSPTLESNEETGVHEGLGVREGWNMETTMNKLGLETEGIEPERWFAYVYEITWVKIE